jgi:DNA-binding MarR family transcriptional regulator
MLDTTVRGRFVDRCGRGAALAVTEPPRHPYRVKRGMEGPPLTASQRRILAALVAVCPDSGCGVDAREVAEAAQLRLGSVVVVLHKLEERRLAMVHPREDDEPKLWAPTMSGRARVRHFPSPAGQESARRG